MNACEPGFATRSPFAERPTARVDGPSPAASPVATLQGSSQDRSTAHPVDRDALAAALPVARFELQLRQVDELYLPAYAGSMLRGAFGHALRKIACATGLPGCTHCPLYRSCPYPSIFETPAVGAAPKQPANPYVVEPAIGERRIPVHGDWSFTFVLAGRALRQLPLVLLAWQRAAGHGFGKSKQRAVLREVCVLDGEQRIPVGWGEKAIEPVMPPAVAAVNLRNAIRLEFLTPLRLQANGRILGPERVDAPRLLLALARRVQNLIDCHGEQPMQLPLGELAQSAAAITADVTLRRRQWTRYSNRQRQATDLTGLVGDVVLRGDLAPFVDLVALGELLHVGKNATFGLGRYRIVEVP